jgi:hypothetical protein
VSGPDAPDASSKSVVFPAVRCMHVGPANGDERPTAYVRLIKLAQEGKPAEFHDVGMCAACFAKFHRAANSILAEG